MITGILARKSTDRQATSIERQIADSRAFALLKGWTVNEDCIFFVPEGVSGAIHDRPEVARLVAAARRGDIGAVIMQTTDRLSRDMITQVHLVQTLHDAGVSVWSYSLGTEYLFDKPMEKLMIAIQGFVAESEREAIVTRTREAAFYRGRSGYVAGGRLYGYDNVRGDSGGRSLVTRAINETQAAWIRQIFAWYADGAGLDSICEDLNRLGVPSPRGAGKAHWKSGSLQPMLKNEHYIGVIVFGRKKKTVIGGRKRVVKGDPSEITRHEVPSLRIVDDATWNRVKAKMDAQKQPGGRRGGPPKALMIGNLRCADCGSRVFVLGGPSCRTYGCSRRHLEGKHTCSNSTKRPVSKVDEVFVAAVRAVLDGPSIVDEVVAKVLAMVGAERNDATSVETALEDRRAELTREVENLVTGIASAKHVSVIGRLAALLDEREAALDAVTRELAARGTGRSRIANETDQVRAEAVQSLANLEHVLTHDVEKGRETLRDLLDGQADATPILVNGEKRLLIRANLRLNKMSDPNATIPELARGPGCGGERDGSCRASGRSVRCAADRPAAGPVWASKVVNPRR
jgi:site-specific DNA recombinase